MSSTPSEQPIRVLIVDEGLSFGGTVVVASMLLKHFDTQAVHACFVTAAGDGFTRARLNGTYDVHFAGAPFNYASEARLKLLLARVGSTSVRRALNHILSATANLLNVGYLLRLFALAVSRRVQVVHCNNTLNVEAVLVAMCLRCPCVFHAHGIGEQSRLVKFLRDRVPSRFIAISRVVRDDLVANGVAPGLIETLHNPVEAPGTSPAELATIRTEERAALGVSSTTILAGIVGRVVRWKGQLEFVAACRLAMARDANLEAVIIGDAADLGDAYFVEVQRAVQESGFADRIHFRGFVSEPDRIYAPLDVLVHSSIEPEPFGLVITEAMVRGIPVIVANTGAPPDFVEAGVTGFVEDPLDFEAVAARLVELGGNDSLRRSMGDAATQQAIRHHDATQYAQRVAGVYRQLVSTS